MELSMLEISEEKIKQLNKKKIFSVEELLELYPRKYIDFRNPANANTAVDGGRCLMICEIKEVIRDTGKNLSYVKVTMEEKQTGKRVTCTWFHQPYLYKEFLPLIYCTVAIGGVVKIDKYGIQYVNPDIFSTDIDTAMGIMPVYSAIKGMSVDFLNRIIDKALTLYDEEESFSEEIMQHFSVPTHKEMLKLIHRPKNEKDLYFGKRRLVFESLWVFAEKMVGDARTNQKYSSFKAMSLTNCQKLIDALPYVLTDDQQKAVMSFVETTQKGERVNALIQGDVGCGKTVCAFLIMLAMSDNGYQSVLMAPTGVLAKQHYTELKSYVEPMGLKCVYLSGELKAAEKKAVLAQIASGEADFVVGTHSVISNDVVFKNLGLTVVDEEHKFGVIQRETLKKKADSGVHNVTMSATPIPRTLALTLYGDSMQLYNIENMPNGRKPVKTCIANNDRSIYNFMLGQIKEKHQCYVVCPLINSDDGPITTEDYTEPPESVEAVYEKMQREFEPYGIKIGVITGKMKDEEKSDIIGKFERNEYQVLIATTIIEVGVNVPNATVITIMNAERFGLAGLHQLRGRVGRSNLQSYCILKSSELNNDRLQVMCDTTKGSEIAERDLLLRGTGDFAGTRQAGDSKDVELMLKYPKFYEEVRSWITKGDSLKFV